MLITSAITFGLILARQGQPLTLDDAIAIASTNSFTLRTAESNVRKAKAKVDEARGALGPKITATGTYQRQEPPPPSFGNFSSPADTKSASIGLNMPIDLVGTTGKLVRAATVQLRGAEQNRDAAKNDLVLNVRQAFYKLLQANAAVKTAEEALARANDRLDQANKEFKEGARAKVDVLQFDTQVKQAQGNLIVAQNGVQTAKGALNQAMGRQILIDLTPGEPTETAPPQQSEEALMDEAKAKRPEIKSLEYTIQSLAYIREFTAGAMSPSLNLSIQHNRAFGETGQFTRSAQTVGVVQLTIPIYDSGVTKAKVREAREDEEQAKISLDQVTLSISLEVHNAFVNLNNAASRLTVANSQLELAREQYRLTALKFDNGEGIAIEVADASTQLTNAQIAVYNAKYDYQNAVAQLDRAIAKPISTGAN